MITSIRMTNVLTVAALFLVASLAIAQNAQAATPSQAVIKRGKYISVIGGCNDCHTPKMMTPTGPAPDPSRLLSGHPALSPVAAVPPDVLGPGKWMAMANADLTAWVGPWGVSFAANLTPDMATGLGQWTAAEFIKTMRTGKRQGVGRAILPPMPVDALAAMTDADLRALFAYLQSIKPIQNKVPEPVAPTGVKRGE